MSNALVGRKSREWDGGIPRACRPTDATMLDADERRPRAGLAVVLRLVTVSGAGKVLAWRRAAWRLPASRAASRTTLRILRKGRPRHCVHGRHPWIGKRRHKLS